MSVGILGKKLGMTQIFDPELGIAIPVTVVQAGPCPVTQIKTKQSDGYTSIQVGYEAVKEKALNKPLLGHLKKSSTAPVRHLKEYRLEDSSSYELGSAITADLFKAGDLVDVAGTTMGRGFAGYQKRHNFKRSPMSHGSKSHRILGSTILVHRVFEIGSISYKTLLSPNFQAFCPVPRDIIPYRMK